MELKATDLLSMIQESLTQVDATQYEEIGIVVQVGDGVCKVHGLTNAVYGELIEFEQGNRGIIFGLDHDFVSLFLLYTNPPISELEVAKRTGSVFKVPVGMQLVGRVINAIGKPIDFLGPLETDLFNPVEVVIPQIIDRSPVNESLETGIFAIDALVPIGKGQRELIIGNRNTGRTALAIDIILHQKNKNVFCIYVSIGQRQANLARTVRLLEENGAMSYTIVISADSSESVLNQYLAPYTGCTIAEYLRDQRHDVLIVYDDLSNHAIAYREMSLLLRQPSGREAYPGDVFYLHSRLLERAGKLMRGGSITALPIAQIQSDDITAYIPTSLISITDGQVFLDTKLFNRGLRPAVNVELSVSRVGGAAQTKAIKKMTRALRLELAQYHELLDFAQFGSELDEFSQKKLGRGARIVALLKQPQYSTYSFVDQVLMLFLLKENYLDSVALAHISTFVLQFVSYVRSVYQDDYAALYQLQDISDDLYQKLGIIAQEFKLLFVPPVTGLSEY